MNTIGLRRPLLACAYEGFSHSGELLRRFLFLSSGTGDLVRSVFFLSDSCAILCLGLSCDESGDHLLCFSACLTTTAGTGVYEGFLRLRRLLSSLRPRSFEGNSFARLLVLGSRFCRGHLVLSPRGLPISMRAFTPLGFPVAAAAGELLKFGSQLASSLLGVRGTALLCAARA